ncbi:MAG: hypothetical protein ACF8GE_08540 [Phycisphaerales bacterium JB043]
MSGAIDRLLDLDSLSWGDENVVFRFGMDLPTWAWIGIIVAALAFSAWSYARLQGNGGARATLAIVRATLLALIVMLIAQPQLVERTEHTEKDWIIVLVDRSLSMQLPDAGDPSSRITRDEQLRNTIASSWPMWEDLRQERVVVWLGFHEYTEDLALTLDGPSLDTPDGRRTNLATAFDDALQRSLARPLAGVVVLSDGRAVELPSRAALRRLQRDLVPVFAVPLGSEISIDDLAIQNITVPESAFASDITPIGVRVTRALTNDRREATARLLNTQTGEVLDEQTIVWSPGQTDASITLLQQSDEPGERNWTVQIVPNGEDLVEINNSEEVAVEIVDRPLRVLFVDGYPRWEQRYVKNLLLREQTIRSSNILLAPNRRFLQDSEDEIYSLPVSPEEWAEFDVVILGDVSPDVFSRDQLLNLRDHVAARGGGLLWIGGSGFTPNAWRDTSLTDLIPFAPSPAGTLPGSVPVTLSPTNTSLDLGVMRLGDVQTPWPAALSDPATGWSVLRWSQRIDPGVLKPASQALALAHDTTSDETWPAVISMRYGSGRVVYVATDEIWRWRYGQGEVLPERFWLQLIRMVGRQSLASDGRRAILEVNPSRATLQQPVRIKITLLDQSLVSSAPDAIPIRLIPSLRDEDIAPVQMELRRESPDADTFVGTWLPTSPATWTVDASEFLRSTDSGTVSFEVVHPNSEFRDPRTDHTVLEQISRDTGGRVLDGDSLQSLPNLLPNRRQRLIKEDSEPLWDTPLALLLVLSLVTIEWVGRRLVRLI